MTAKQLAEELELEVLTGDGARAVDGCYCGDLLSWVMAKAPADSVWLTVMGNVNAIAVAVLKDLACIVLTENAVFDEDARQRAEQQDVTVLRTAADTYTLAVRLAGLL